MPTQAGGWYQMTAGQNYNGYAGLIAAINQAGMDSRTPEFEAAWAAIPPDQQAALLADLRHASAGTGNFGWDGPDASLMQVAQGRLAAALKNSAKAAADKAQTEADTRDVTTKMKEFYDMLNSPVFDKATGTYSDPLAKQLANVGASTAAHKVGASGMSGMRGGYSAAAGGAGTEAALAPYLSQRQSMAQQALGMMSQRNIGLAQMQQNQQSLDMQRIANDSNASLQQWQYNQEHNQGVLGTITGGIGAIAAGIATQGNPQAIAGGWSAGSKIGAGISGVGGQAPTRSSAAYGLGT